MTEKAGVSKERQLADVALDPLFGGAIIACSFGKSLCGEPDFTSLYEALDDRAKAVRGNKLGSAKIC